jgi:hypothetical protein
MLSLLLFVGGGVLVPRYLKNHLELGPLTEAEFEKVKDELRPHVTPVKKCECIECDCGTDCKCSGGVCECTNCKPKPVVPADPEVKPVVRSYYAIAYREAIEKKCRLIVFNGVGVQDVSGDKGIAVVLDGHDPDFKMPRGIFVYEFKSDGVRPAGLYGGLYSGASGRSGVKDGGPVYSCGPGGCRRIR